MGKEGLEPSRLSAHDPKSCLSANSNISPDPNILSYLPLFLNSLLSQLFVPIFTGYAKIKGAVVGGQSSVVGKN